MFIKNITNKKRLEIICSRMEVLVRSEKFLSDVKSIDYFDMSKDLTGFVVGEEMVEIIERGISQQVYITTKWLFNKSVLGYFKGGDIIYLNSRRLNRSDASIAGTIFHEFIHLIDSKLSASFGHGDNSPIGKEKTAPYLLGSLFQLHYKRIYG